MTIVSRTRAFVFIGAITCVSLGLSDAIEMHGGLRVLPVAINIAVAILALGGPFRFRKASDGPE